MSGLKATWRCTCGARCSAPVEREEDAGYQGTLPDSCEPCWEAAEERAYRNQWMDYAYGPGPAVFDGDW